MVPPDRVPDGCEDSGGDGKELTPVKVSEKVLSQINAVSKLLGVSFEGQELVAMRLFSAIEAS